MATCFMSRMTITSITPWLMGMILIYLIWVVLSNIFYFHPWLGDYPDKAAGHF